MAKVYDKEIDKNVDWGGDKSTGNLPVKGLRVQEFIKKSLENRIGILHYDSANNRYLAFADITNRDAYIDNPSRTELILGTFDAPFNYSASIRLTSPQRVNIFKGSVGNYIEFTFDTFNKEGLSVGEDVICTFTFLRGTAKKVVSAKYSYKENVRFLIDDYLQNGTNTISISIQGQNTFAATSIAVVYGVIDLSLSDEFDIAAVHNISDGGEHQLEIPYTVSGQGTKQMEWYIDGEKSAFVKDEDEIIESSSYRTKYIDISNLSHGRHSLQMRTCTTVDGEMFYSDTLYRDFFVITQTNATAILIGIKTTIPGRQGVVDAGKGIRLYGLTQYVRHDMSFAVYNPANPAATPVTIYRDDNAETTVNTVNGSTDVFSFTPVLPSETTIKFVAGDTEYQISGNVEGSSMNISEITSGLSFAFSASGRSNSAADRNVFTYDEYIGEFNGFQWNKTSGWNDNILKINEGASFGVDWAPLGGDPAGNGFTLEIAFRTINVSDDDRVICSLMKDGVGLEITASSATLHSREGKFVSTRFKSEEDVRLSFVINRRTGATNKGLAFIYIDGILSGAVKFAASDSFSSDINFSMSGTSDAEIELRQIRSYATALSSDQILNNFILYQNTVKGMQDTYYRNDISEDGSQSLSMDKLEKFLPVMLVTGNIPILENTNNKKEQITVDIDYFNLLDPSRSFTMKKAAMTPQGTSSMSYPKKNFRIYTKKIDDTRVYDAAGNEIPDKLYSFKEKAQPVGTWCLKADYAESSGTHNTGIARLWNDALYDAQIDGEYKLRTAAQVAALQNGFEYDVRTTIDGFPILMFYRLNEDSDIIFLGKYNFNNDKSTESVFGFRDIPGFDNTRMQCWEVLNNGNHLALFLDTTNWNEEWSDAFEARYPDGGEDTSDLKAFAQWLVGVKDNAEAFATSKWEHLDVYKTAAYYVYLMRFGAVDQTVKNAMLTSEDGTHFYFINYDNDTINGVRNDGLLIYPPTIDRQTLDESYATEVYAYAGHDSVLWNRLEADDEFLTIVSIVDNALYQSGLRYNDVMRVFNTEQSGKWCEKIYNQDAQYKYIGPFVNDGIDNLFMLQGSREAHRKWWLSRRFSLLDSKYVSGAYKSNVLECKMASAPAGIQFGITAGYDMDYGYGVNNVVVEKGVSLKTGASHLFTTKQVLNIGDPMRIYSANNLREADLSGFIKYLSTVNIASVNDQVLGTRLKSLTLGDGINENTSLSEIQGLAAAKRLEQLNVEGFKAITSLNLSEAYYLKSLYAKASGLKSVELPQGAKNLTILQLPTGLQSLVLKDLTGLDITGITLEGNGKSLLNVSITGSPKCSVFALVKNIVANASGLQSIEVDNIDWKCTADDLLSLVKGKAFSWVFRGKVTIDAVDQSIVDRLQATFGSSCFDKSSAFYIIAPDSIFISGASEVLEGDSETFSAVVFSQESGKGQTIFKIQSGSRVGTTLDSATGVLTTIENGNADATLTILVQYISPSGKISSTSKSVIVKKRTYPTSAQISAAIRGESRLNDVGTPTQYTCSLDGFTGRIASMSWELSGEITEYAEITSQMNGLCKVTLNKNVDAIISGTLTLTLTKVIGGTISGTFTVSAINDSIAISKATNPVVMNAFYKAGLAANENYMTKTECALVVDSDMTYDKLNSNLRNATSFDEFKYFTSITTIKDNLFSASRLKSITLPSGLKSIDYGAFRNCSSLTSVTIPSGVMSIGSSAFNGCSSLISIIIPESVTSIGTNVFEDCSSLKSVTIPSGVTRIENSTFDGCSSLTSIIIPENVTRIGDYAFKDCSSLISITIPESVTIIGSGAFNGCSSLTSITIPKNITKIGDWTFSGCSSLTAITIPENVTIIDARAFNNCSSLKSVTIPENVTNISSYAFYGCSSLTSITIPSKVSNLGATVFANCGGSLNIDVVESNAYYSSADGVLFNKLKTTIINYAKDKSQPVYHIPDSVTSIESEAFSECSSLTSITIPESVTSIGTHAFYNCSSLKSVTIPSGVTKIEALTFSGCSSLMSIIIPESVTSIGINVFGNCSSLKSVTIPSGVTRIENSTFDGCSSLTSITIPDSVTSIGSDAFYNCSSLTAITIPSGVTKISMRMLAGCLSLKTINCLRQTAPSIEMWAFGWSETDYTGRNSYNTGENKLYVPTDATGYDTDMWLSVLCNADRCGFTLYKTL